MTDQLDNLMADNIQSGSDKLRAFNVKLSQSFKKTRTISKEESNNPVDLV